MEKEHDSILGKCILKVDDIIVSYCEYYWKDFCPCVKNNLAASKYNTKVRNSEYSINFLERHNINYTTTKTENIILVDYLYDKYYVSLINFTFRKKGTKDWLKKKKQIIGLNSTLSFGKYKGYTINDIIVKDKQYIYWLINNTDYLFNNNIIDALKNK